MVVSLPYEHAVLKGPLMDNDVLASLARTYFFVGFWDRALRIHVAMASERIG